MSKTTKSKTENQNIDLRTSEEIRLENIYSDFQKQHNFYKTEIDSCNSLIVNYNEIIELISKKAKAEKDRIKQLELLIRVNDYKIRRNDVHIRKESSSHYLNVYVSKIDSHETNMKDLILRAKKEHKNVLKSAKMFLKSSLLDQDQRKRLKNTIKLFDNKFANEKKFAYAFKSLSMECSTSNNIINAKKKQ